MIEADLPGVRREDMSIELIGNELSISGEIRERERKGIVRRRARHTGRFDYDVTLPSLLEADRIEAKLADGVLTLRVPKAERAQATAHRGHGFLSTRRGRAAGAWPLRRVTGLRLQ